jgi:mitochondrial enoyl-[acyl-carrier protein] reductase / trans-2-enoyl-CoA reductase
MDGAAMKTMKQILLEKYGRPEDGVRCAEVPDVGPPCAAEVVFDVLLFPINPADISLCRGTYRLKPALPTTPGAECIGRVAAVGAAVSHVKVGDLVINLQRENWAQRRRVKGEEVIAVPAGMDLQQAAMLRINPPTALLLLTDFVSLKPGDWIIQNVANSAVGRLLIRLARDRAVKTVNVVRRESLFAELTALGADVCVVDGPGLAEQVKARTGGGAIRLGIDAVAGQATARMAACLAENGAVVNYGSMSGEDPMMPRYVLSNVGVTLAGFTLGRGLARRSPAEVRAIYADLGGRVMRGTLQAPVEKVYPIEEIKAAVAHAQQGERAGKILVKP